MSAAPGTGTGIPARAATFRPSTTATPSIRNWRRAWKWSEKYATQPEILRYLGFVADRYDLRRDIRFHTKITAATWDQAAERWLLTTDNGAGLSCRHYIMATGCLSSPKPPEIEGVKDFKGEIYFTGRWPHHEVKLAGKRVAVIGTGSSGHPGDPADRRAGGASDRVPAHAELCLPAHNGPAPADRVGLLESDRAGYREQARWSMAGVPFPPAHGVELAAERCRAPRTLRAGVGRRRSRRHPDPALGRPGRRRRRQRAGRPS